MPIGIIYFLFLLIFLVIGSFVYIFRKKTEYLDLLVMKRILATLLVASALFSCENKNAADFYEKGNAILYQKPQQDDSTTRVENLKVALQDFDSAIENDPNYEKAYESRALVKRALNDYQGCLADAEKILTL